MNAPEPALPRADRVCRERIDIGVTIVAAWIEPGWRPTAAMSLPAQLPEEQLPLLTLCNIRDVAFALAQLSNVLECS